ncbi:MAG TPA: DUF6797 domain-containing protein, partial [Planctomycetota bacterium]|nr:DUF6797 domain-containing protein [Planctomycetota bacterium]
VAAVWTGGWLDLASRVYADDSNDYCWIRGTVVHRTPRKPGWAKDGSFDDPRPAPGDGPLPRDWARFRGHYRHGREVVVAYTVASREVLESYRLEDGLVRRTLNIAAGREALLLAEGPTPIPPDATRLTVTYAPGGPRVAPGGADLAPFTKAGPPLWPETLETAVAEGKDDAFPYVVDAIGLPEANPWKSWLRFTGIDFFPDGRIAVSTWSGDVFVVELSGSSARWRRFAAGLGQPMGLKVVDGKVMTSGRDQITRLHDLDGDGEADFYECFNNEIFLTTNFHEFTFDLQTDAKGDFYVAKGSAIWAGSLRMTPHSGTVIRIPKDGVGLDVLCTGLRAPNGLAVGPDGLITVSDNQGNWVPECPINVVRKGAYYGFVGHEQKPQDRETPLCWIPMTVDKSPGTQVYVPDDRWGPLKGKAIICSYDCSISLLLWETLPDGTRQGGVVKFPFTFPSGVMRGRFSPADGQLYVAGMRGWSSRAARDACLQRVRWTGRPLCWPSDVRTRAGGLDVTFTTPLDTASAADAENVGAIRFNVVRTGNYGSPEFSVKDPKKTGRDPAEVTRTRLSADGRTLAVDIPDLAPVTNLILKFRLKSADGAPVKLDLNWTVHRVPGAKE